MTFTNSSNDLMTSSLNVLLCFKHNFTNPKTPPLSLNTFSTAKSATIENIIHLQLKKSWELKIKTSHDESIDCLNTFTTISLVLFLVSQGLMHENNVLLIGIEIISFDVSNRVLSRNQIPFETHESWIKFSWEKIHSMRIIWYGLKLDRHVRNSVKNTFLYRRNAVWID